MSNIVKGLECKPEDLLCQGDIFKEVNYGYMAGEEYIEFSFPYAVIISQACDVNFMDTIVRNKEGKATKFMPSILLCPVYNTQEVKDGKYVELFSDLKLNLIQEPVYNSKDQEVIRKNWHYRFYQFDIELKGDIILQDKTVDFKHYFSVPANILIENIGDRVCHIDDIFAEQFTLRFASFLCRVAIPDI